MTYYELFLYLSIFLFGYSTCFVFYFAKAVNFYSLIIKRSILLSLFIVVRSMEHFEYAKEFRLNIMKKSGESKHNILAAKMLLEYDIEMIQKSYFDYFLDFQKGTPYKIENWTTALQFLNQNRDIVEDIINKQETK